MNTKELIVSELESTSEDLLSEVLEFVKSIKRQQPISISTTARQRTPNLEQGKIIMSDDFNVGWDRQIETDFGEGKLDRLIAKASLDIANNNVRDLDEVLQTDPDVGLEVNSAVIEQLLAIRKSKSPTLTTEEVKQRLGSIEDEHPILKFAVIFKDDSDFDAVVANIEKDRSTNIED
jgi:hypothetical protein